MAFSNPAFSPALSLLISSLLIQIVISIEPLYTIYSTSKKFITNSPYQKNLHIILGDLYFKTPPKGFGLSSLGQYQDQAYGLSLCRGDVSTKDCTTCLVEASSTITKSCPTNKEAIIWYDDCYLKYSDKDFFGKIDNQNKFYMWNTRNVSHNVDEFNEKTKELLKYLGGYAYETSKMYAKGEVGINEGDEKIYGMVQCSRDVSRNDCRKCVHDAVSELPLCCEGKKGGRVVGGSCNIRYEIYPFLN
ncbi:hypothetical protein ACS0TY_017831 [Phlomoides rotata]